MLQNYDCCRPVVCRRHWLFFSTFVVLLLHHHAVAVATPAVVQRYMDLCSRLISHLIRIIWADFLLTFLPQLQSIRTKLSYFQLDMNHPQNRHGSEDKVNIYRECSC